MQSFRRNKYHARKCTINGVTYDSKKEAARAQDLIMLEKAGQIHDLKLQVPFLLQDSFERNGEKFRKAEEIARKAAEEAALKAAEELEKQGMTAAADAIMETPVSIAKVEVPQFEKTEGVSYRKQYSAEVVSLMDLVKAAAAGTVPIAYIQANTTALNAWARSTKGSDTIPGVRVVTENIQSRRI